MVRQYASNRNVRREGKRAHHKVTKDTKLAVPALDAAHCWAADFGVASGHAGNASKHTLSPRRALAPGRFVNLVTLCCTSPWPHRDFLAWDRSRKITFSGIAVFGQKPNGARHLRRGKIPENVAFPGRHRRHAGEPLTGFLPHCRNSRHAPSRKDPLLSPKPAPTPSAAAPKAAPAPSGGTPAAPASTCPAITPNIIAEHGLPAEEYQLILSIMGREPNLTELGIFSVMWSEHCSYKSSKVWLKKLPTSGPQVIQGPGENAGVIDIGDGLAAVFKMESHNHPSFIEPYQGAATGVGGIMRDVFTMGARPIANLNALRFGSPDDPKTRHLVAGVVKGIGGYGNCMGVPTVGGEVNFHASYNGNILVNAMTVGLAPADRIFYSAAAGVGNPVIYVGAKTGRDGIHGATMASAEFNEDSEEKRPTVQVGDPFTEKLLLEACLELMATDAIVSIQDMGAAGLTSSSVEMAGKGGLGIELDIDKVPMRERGMSAYEVMLSESQERMLMILKPGREDVAMKIFAKYELDCAIIGKVTTTGKLVVKKNGKVEADMPVEPMVTQSPEYDRPWTKTPQR